MRCGRSSSHSAVSTSRKSSADPRASRRIFLDLIGIRIDRVIVIDTNVLSESTRWEAEPAVIAWSNAQPIEDLYTTAVTESEMLYGLACVPAGRRHDRFRRAIETAFLGAAGGPCPVF